MFKIKCLFFFLISTLIVSNAAFADIKSVCPNIRELGACQYKSNSPVRACARLTCPISRFALNPTIIFTNEKGQCGNPAQLSRASIYDKNGNLLCSGAQKLGCAARRGVCLSRYKADENKCNTRTIVRRALANTKSPEIYWKVSSSSCFRVPDAGRCYNVKVREVCAKVIR